jgi:hypothetical protein
VRIDEGRSIENELDVSRKTRFCSQPYTHWYGQHDEQSGDEVRMDVD